MSGDQSDLTNFLAEEIQRMAGHEATSKIVSPMARAQLHQQVKEETLTYLQEMLRVGKNKAVCLRALIQNMYLQMNS